MACIVHLKTHIPVVKREEFDYEISVQKSLLYKNPKGNKRSNPPNCTYFFRLIFLRTNFFQKIYPVFITLFLSAERQ